MVLAIRSIMSAYFVSLGGVRLRPLNYGMGHPRSVKEKFKNYHHDVLSQPLCKVRKLWLTILTTQNWASRMASMNVEFHQNLYSSAVACCLARSWTSKTTAHRVTTANLVIGNRPLDNIQIKHPYRHEALFYPLGLKGGLDSFTSWLFNLQKWAES